MRQTPSEKRLRTRLLLNEGWLEELYAQVEPMNGPLRLDSLSLKVRTGFIDGQGTLKRGHRPPPPWTEVLDSVVEGLRETGQLAALRPETAQDYQRSQYEYVYEFTRATRLGLPVSRRGRGSPKELAIWIADPPPRRSEPEHEWDFFGSYLFLVESDHRPSSAYSRFYLSGVSALAKCVRLAQPGVDRGVVEDLGRSSSEHPIQKLERLGAVASVEREIETLYSIRYVTDEQCGWSVSEGRANDILAYPLAILC